MKKILSKINERKIYFLISILIFIADIVSKYFIDKYLQPIYLKKIIGNFCQICGAPARNYCTNYFWNEDSYQPCAHSEPLPGNARYCPDCGAKSLFFYNDILDAWDIEYSQFMEEEASKANMPTASDGFMNIPEPNEGSASFPFFDELPFK